jgi:hypothetical protein
MLLRKPATAAAFFGFRDHRAEDKELGNQSLFV